MIHNPMLPPGRWVVDPNTKVVVNEDTGEPASLTEAQVDIILDQLKRARERELKVALFYANESKEASS